MFAFLRIRSHYLVLSVALLMGSCTFAQQREIAVGHFEKVIVSPHIQVKLVEGEEESVTVETSKLPLDQIHAQVDGRTLWVYLEHAKVLTGSEDNGKQGNPYYRGTEAIVTISYKTLNTLSVRGNEYIRFEDPLVQKNFTLRIYGESQVYLSEVDLEALRVTIYGSSFLEVRGGHVDKQRFTAYGESRINTMAVTNGHTRIVAYGESDIQVKVTGKLKVTCYGESHIIYEGSPVLKKGLVIGEATIRKVG